MGAGGTFARYLVCTLNLIFVLLGSAAVGFGIWILTSKNAALEFQRLEVSPQTIRVVGWSLISIGSVLVVVAGLGLCGALTKQACLLRCYCIFLVVILFAEIAVLILIGVYKRKGEAELPELVLKRLVQKYEAGNDKSNITKNFNDYMSSNQCCGVNGHKDFRSFIKVSDPIKKGEILPDACCKTRKPCTEAYAYSQECGRTMRKSIGKTMVIAMIIGGVLIFLQFIWIGLVGCVANRAEQDYSRIE